MSRITAEEGLKPATGVPVAKTDPDAPGWRGLLKKGNFRDYGLMIALVLIMLFFEYTTHGVLFQPLNLTNLILQNSYVVVMALGMLLVIVAGHIDLSIGSLVGFVGALAAVLMVNYNVNYALATIMCLAVGGLIGASQGYFIAYLKIPSFIVTLAGMLVFRGLTLAVLQGASVGPFPDFFQLLSKGFIPKLNGFDLSLPIAAVLWLILVGTGWRRLSNQRKHGVVAESVGSFLIRNGVIGLVLFGFAFQMTQYRGLPNVLIIMFVLIMLYRFVTNKTTIGRRIYALGGNVKAAKLSGIKTERLTFLTFVNMGVLAGLAGMIFAARLNTATPKGGVGFELDVIAACFIGGASAAGGVGKVTGAVIGAFIIGVMNNGMSIMGIGIDYQQVIKGLVLLAAVCLDVYNKNKA
ncbi:multiple monosaccharide ABC transporter permease [Lichenifustis flavocetrariae]|uniref:Xylose transport system permease protein XylH n=1 Tax=Lichenifustis flavocetrariae TaxID=2949735 RepID=A0AA42CN61_9HYPH|nr:multiple monosaccharide ABC transporter permease [Lichenifustis flavocetrariae]MCW6509077.1 sugar ABC transporter permease [Lichenifustis flavocetrariae]